jgi:hypothetical protein
VALVLVFHLEVTGSIHAATTFFLLDKQSLLFFHPLEPILSFTVCCWQASSQQNEPSKKLWNVQK